MQCCGEPRGGVREELVELVERAVRASADELYVGVGRPSKTVVSASGTWTSSSPLITSMGQLARSASRSSIANDAATSMTCSVVGTVVKPVALPKMSCMP